LRAILPPIGDGEYSTDRRVHEILERYQEVERLSTEVANGTLGSSAFRKALNELDSGVKQMEHAVRQLPSNSGEQSVLYGIRDVGMYAPSGNRGIGWAACAIRPQDNRLVGLSMLNAPDYEDGMTLVKVDDGSFYVLVTTAHTEGSLGSSLVSRSTSGISKLE
jgi:hypothetical protein